MHRRHGRDNVLLPHGAWYGVKLSGPGLTGAAAARSDNELVVKVEPGQFEEMVIAVLDELPEDLGRLMRNVQ
jgi:hypothetical protein